MSLRIYTECIIKIHSEMERINLFTQTYLYQGITDIWNS